MHRYVHRYISPTPSYILQSPLTAISITALGSIRTLVLQIPASSPLYLQESDLASRVMEYQLVPALDIMRTMRSTEKDWEAMWQLLQKHATSLENLHVKIYDRGYRHPEAQLLQPLKSLKVPNFTIQLPWRRDYQPEFAIESDDGHAFKILRPNEIQVRVHNIISADNGTHSPDRGRKCSTPISLLCSTICIVAVHVYRLFATVSIKEP
jgi:hypothetical protein